MRRRKEKRSKDGGEETIIESGNWNWTSMEAGEWRTEPSGGCKVQDGRCSAVSVRDRTASPACYLSATYRVSRQLPRTERCEMRNQGLTSALAPMFARLSPSPSPSPRARGDSKETQCFASPDTFDRPHFFCSLGFSICLFPNAATEDVGLQCL